MDTSDLTPQLYTLTKNPNIFKASYWGGGKRHCIPHQIIENRNKFVTDYGICRHVGKRPEYVNKIAGINEGYSRKAFDHVEVYFNNSSQYVVIVSPYWVSDESFQLLTSKGFTVYEPLYTTDATTFIKVINKGAKN